MSSREAAHLNRFVHSLERVDRLVLMLHYAESLTPKEIGLILELTEKQVCTKLTGLQRRARLFLQANLLSRIKAVAG